MVKSTAFISGRRGWPEDFVVDVPPGHYFAVGDNRDDSNGSRYWGFVPAENLVGRPFLVWMGWDSLAKTYSLAAHR